jgi:hypothetical protein
MKNRFVFLLLVLLGLIILDRLLTGWADRILREHNAYIDTRYNVENLEMTDNVFQHCKTDNVLLIYNYRTCFVGIGLNRDGHPVGYAYRYIKPRPKFSLWRLLFSEADYLNNAERTGINLLTFDRNYFANSVD